MKCRRAQSAEAVLSSQGLVLAQGADSGQGRVWRKLKSHQAAAVEGVGSCSSYAEACGHQHKARVAAQEHLGEHCRGRAWACPPRRVQGSITDWVLVQSAGKV